MTDDKGSFRQIYERYYPGILRFLTRLVGEDEAEDVAQEVFLRVDRGLPAFRGEAAIGIWIYTKDAAAKMDGFAASLKGVLPATSGAKDPVCCGK